MLSKPDSISSRPWRKKVLLVFAFMHNRLCENNNFADIKLYCGNKNSLQVLKLPPHPTLPHPTQYPSHPAPPHPVPTPPCPAPAYCIFPGIEITLAQSPVATGFGLGRVELIENHLFFAPLASEEFVFSASNVTRLFLNITYMLSCSLIFSWAWKHIQARNNLLFKQLGNYDKRSQ